MQHIASYRSTTRYVFLLSVVIASTTACRDSSTDDNDSGDISALDTSTQPADAGQDTAPVQYDLCDPVSLSNDFGDCGNSLGVAFDGDFCNYVLGCDCEPHCAQMFNTIEDCEITCLGYTVCANDSECGDGMYCAFEADDACGDSGVTALCKPNPMMCPSTSQPVCGCDGQTYDNDCKANAAGTGIRSDGAC